MTAATLKWHHELNWRPWSYTDFADPTALIVNGIRGQLRRSNARTDLGLVYDKANSGGHLDWFADSDEWLHGSADEEVWEISSKMFNWRVGESLPEPLPGEIEIARIILQSVLMDVISIRAQWRWGRYHYRIVDEYESTFDISRKSSNKPLTLGQLIDLLQGSSCPDWTHPCGMIEGFWEAEREHGMESLEDNVNFASIESDFYPKLADWYDQRGEEWIAEYTEEEEEE